MQTDTTIPNVASVCAAQKAWPVLNFAQQLPTTRINAQQGVQTDVTCNIQLTMLGVVGQQWCVRLQRSFIDQSYFVKKKCKSRFNKLKRTQKGKKENDRDEKMMTVERALQIRRPVCRSCSSVLVSFTSIHKTYTFHLGGIYETFLASLETNHNSVN